MKNKEKHLLKDDKFKMSRCIICGNRENLTNRQIDKGRSVTLCKYCDEAAEDWAGELSSVDWNVVKKAHRVRMLHYVTEISLYKAEHATIWSILWRCKKPDSGH